MPDQQPEKDQPIESELSEDLKQRILLWARAILEKKLNHEPPPQGPDLAGLRGGVFVTLKLDGNLRGCIGRFDFTALLSDSIRDMVLAAAFNDYRFHPLTKDELADLDITISVLTKPRPLNSLDDLVIGRDGLYLTHPMGSGVLLPVVAVEHGFSPLEFARCTAIKAGLMPEDWNDPKAKLMVFTAPAFSTDPQEVV
ncbi:MAG: AmmeMemoRadiSam system protein A [Deltaproteobacteria bacterium]|nr:AmmeMemoRadiSam system protein A [Deltaproteobacteria bacterium]